MLRGNILGLADSDSCLSLAVPLISPASSCCTGGRWIKVVGTNCGDAGWDSELDFILLELFLGDWRGVELTLGPRSYFCSLGFLLVVLGELNALPGIKLRSGSNSGPHHLRKVSTPASLAWGHVSFYI